MFSKKQRDEFLKQIVQTDAGLAVIDLLEEKARELKDARNFPMKNFEINGKASLKAAAKLEEVIFDLKRLGEPGVEKTPKQYE